MRDKPQTIQGMLAAALQAQVDLGLDDMIVNRAELQAMAEALAAEAPAPTRSPGSPAVDDDAEAWVQNLDSLQKAPGVPSLVEEMPTETPQPHYESLDSHYQAICDCMKCPLGKTRTKFVYGVGNPTADLMFIGEGPGRDEDLQGEPFVGKAGQLLNKIIAAMDLKREDVYIANMVKCRPPNNRDPLPEEMAECFPYLKEQVRQVRPKAICCLGRIAGQALLNTKTPLGRLRQRWHEFEGVPVLVTYHPAALLRFPAYKRDTWDDMKLVMNKLAEQKDN